MGEKVGDLPYHASGRLTHLAILEYFYTSWNICDERGSANSDILLLNDYKTRNGGK